MPAIGGSEIAAPVAPLVTVAPWSVTAPRDLPPPEPTADEVQTRIDEILRGAEFRPPPRNPIERARDWIFEKIGELLAEAFGGGAGSIISYVVLAVASAVLVFFVVKLVRGVRRDAVQRSVASAEVGWPVEAWLADAAAHESRGEWRLALRCRYRALVADLAARGLVDEIPGRTTGEYRREVATSIPAAAPAFSGATELFELAWYGARDTGPGETERFAALAGSVLTDAGR